MPAAKCYRTTHPRTPFLVVYTDHARKTASGRHRRVQRWFADEAEARRHAEDVNRSIAREGTAGTAFDALARADAVAARRLLDEAGYKGRGLAAVAADWVLARPAGGARAAFGPAVEEFCAHKEAVQNRAARTVENLRRRLALWGRLAALTQVDQIDAAALRLWRDRPGVTAQTRVNDLAAASSFCAWAVECGLLAANPAVALARPTVPRRTPPVLAPEEARALLAAARAEGAEALGALAVLLFCGARPSELAETRLFYGRGAAARIEGGKLRGRANRLVPLSPAARAWLRAAGSPARVRDLTRAERRRMCRAAGVPWRADFCRHSFISYRLAALADDARTAREAGTSAEMVFRHYHRLVTPQQARAWAALRPGGAGWQSTAGMGGAANPNKSK